MSLIGDFYDSDVLPRIFEKMDSVLPEFAFKRTGRGWISSNALRVTGVEGSKPGTAYVYSDRPWRIMDFASGGKPLSEYLKESPLHPVNTFEEGVDYLAKKVGLTVPERDLSPQERERLQEAQLKAELLESANDFFIDCLSREDNEFAKTPDAKSLRLYLQERKYVGPGIKGIVRFPDQEFDPKARYMEVGFIPSKVIVKKHLLTRGFAERDIERFFLAPESGGEAKALHLSVGLSHRLTIPLRDPFGRIQGFAFRTIDPIKEKKGKYLYSSGLSRSRMLFNLRAVRGDQDLIIVEGLFDALYARALGRENVVALGGTSFNEDQLKTAIKFGAKKITLCLDSDEAGKTATKAIITLFNRVRPELNLYVAELPAGFKDPDELIREKGIEAFESVLRQAHSYYTYQLNQIAHEANALKAAGPFNDKDRDRLLKEVDVIGKNLRGVGELSAFGIALKEIAPIFGLTPEAIDEDLERIAGEQAKETQAAEMRKALNKAKELIDAGQTDAAAEFLSNTGKQLNTGLLDTSYHSLLKAPSEAELTARIQSRPESVKSGFMISGDDLLFPSGAISIIAAPTSHGKTTFLINAALNVVQAYPEQRAYLFSYEESQEDVLTKALNIYANTEFSKNNKRTIQGYFREGSLKYFSQNQETFKSSKEIFFKQLVEAQRFFVEYTSYDSDQLIGAIRYLKKNTEISAVFIDYMQLIRLPERLRKGGMSRQEELKQICLDLKDCAVETGLPIILGAQFNRTVTEIGAIHSTAIGEAGDIERIANVIIGLWNKQFPELGKEPTRESKIYAQVLKSRDSGAGKIENFLFNGNTGKIENERPKEYELNLGNNPSLQELNKQSRFE